MDDFRKLTPSDKKKILSLLEDLHNKFTLSKRGHFLRYVIEDFFTKDEKKVANHIKTTEIISWLEKWGALEIHKDEVLDEGIVYYLKVIQPDFDDFRHLFENPSQKLVTKSPLKPVERVKFDDNTGILSLGRRHCQLPLLRYEHLLCNLIYNKPFSHPIGWDEACEATKGTESDLSAADKRTLYDTVLKLNARIKEQLKITPFIEWKGRVIRRVR